MNIRTPKATFSGISSPPPPLPSSHIEEALRLLDLNEAEINGEQEYCLLDRAESGIKKCSQRDVERILRLLESEKVRNPHSTQHHLIRYAIFKQGDNVRGALQELIKFENAFKTEIPSDAFQSRKHELLNLLTIERSQPMQDTPAVLEAAHS